VVGVSVIKVLIFWLQVLHGTCGIRSYRAALTCCLTPIIYNDVLSSNIYFVTKYTSVGSLTD
jgi:hypothetical protein